MELTEEMKECIESCLYTLASLAAMHNISERQRDIEQCLEMIELGLKAVNPPHLEGE